MIPISSDFLVAVGSFAATAASTRASSKRRLDIARSSQRGLWRPLALDDVR